MGKLKRSKRTRLVVLGFDHPWFEGGRTWSVFEMRRGAISSRGGAGPFTSERRARAWIAAPMLERRPT